MSSASSCIIVLVLQFPGEEVQGWARAFPDLSLSFSTLLRSLAITYLPGSASGGVKWITKETTNSAGKQTCSCSIFYTLLRYWGLCPQHMPCPPHQIVRGSEGIPSGGIPWCPESPVLGTLLPAQVWGPLALRTQTRYLRPWLLAPKLEDRKWKRRLISKHSPEPCLSPNGRNEQVTVDGPCKARYDATLECTGLLCSDGSYEGNTLQWLGDKGNVLSLRGRKETNADGAATGEGLLSRQSHLAGKLCTESADLCSAVTVPPRTDSPFPRPEVSRLCVTMTCSQCHSSCPEEGRKVGFGQHGSTEGSFGGAVSGRGGAVLSFPLPLPSRRSTTAWTPRGGQGLHLPGQRPRQLLAPHSKVWGLVVALGRIRRWGL